MGWLRRWISFDFNELKCREKMATLSDRDIKLSMRAGCLVRNGSEAQLGPASYELRMGHIYYDLTESDRRIDATGYGSILIKPGHRVVLITMEDLDVPNDVVARVVSKGSLFSIGLSPVSTYADPGFSGNLGIVTQNLSDRFIELPIGEAIAKIEFSKLTGPVERPYRGQHGFQTRIWPIRHELQRTFKDVEKDGRVESEEAESYKILPQATVTVIKKLKFRQSVTNWSIFAAVIMNSLALIAVTTKFIDNVVSLAINLVSSVIVGLVLLVSRREG